MVGSRTTRDTGIDSGWEERVRARIETYVIYRISIKQVKNS